MKLRWIYEKNLVTAEMVQAEREKSFDNLETCKKRLEARTPKVLQFWVSFSDKEDDGYWENIPTICELIDVANDCSTEKEE